MPQSAHPSSAALRCASCNALILRFVTPAQERPYVCQACRSGAQSHESTTPATTLLVPRLSPSQAASDRALPARFSVASGRAFRPGRPALSEDQRRQRNRDRVRAHRARHRQGRTENPSADARATAREG
jgi:hypothetical protein